MTHRYTPPKNRKQLPISRVPVIAEGLGIELPVHDRTFTNRSLQIARQVRQQNIRGVEIRVPTHEFVDNPEGQNYRKPGIKLLARRILSDACRDFSSLSQTPVAEVAEQILSAVPELENPMQITFDSVLAPVDRKSGERYVMLSPSHDDAEFLEDLRSDVYDAILDASGVLLRQNNRPVDLTVAYAHSYVDLRTSTSLAKAYEHSLPLEINFGPATISPAIE